MLAPLFRLAFQISRHRTVWPGVRWSCSLGLGILAGLLARSVCQAQPRWQAPPTCLAEREFQAKAAKLAAGAQSLRFEVRKQGASYELTVLDDGVKTHRLRAKSCQGLERAALTLLQLGRSEGKKERKEPGLGAGQEQSGARVEQQEPQVRQTQGPRQTVASSSEASPSLVEKEALAQGPLRKPEKSEPQGASQAIVRRNARRSKRLGRWLVALQGGAGLGAMPRFYGLVGAQLGWERKGWRVQGGPQLALGSTSPQSVEGSWRANFRLWAGSARGCWIGQLRALRLPLCAGFEAGALQSWRSSLAPGPKELWTPWWGVNLRAGVELDFSERLFFQSFLDASLLPRRPSVEIEDGPRLCCGAFAGGLQAGLGLRLGRSKP